MTQEKMQDLVKFWGSTSMAVILADMEAYLTDSKTKISVQQRDLAVLKLKERFSDKLNATDIFIALQIVIGRTQNKKSLAISDASPAFYLKTQLEQATHPIVASYHASYYENCRQLYDLCCGLGFDTMAFSRVVDKVTAIEQDPLVAAFCELNMRAKGYDNVNVVCSSVENYVAAQQKFKAEAIWADPDRRASTSRVRSIEDYSPTIQYLEELDCIGPFGIKLSALALINSDRWQQHFIGFANECKEQVIWRAKECSNTKVFILGEQARDSMSIASAWSVANQVNFSDCSEVLVDQVQPNSYLIEPHAALLASRQLNNFLAEYKFDFIKTAKLGHTKQLPEKTLLQSGIIRAYKIEELCSFRVDKVKQLLKQLGCTSNIIIKKAGVSESAEKIRGLFKFEEASNKEDNKDLVLYVIQVGKHKLAAFCRRVMLA